MKLSCLPVSYFSLICTGKMTIKQWAQQARDLGLDAIDLSIILIDYLNTDSLKALRKEIESCDLELAVLNTYPDFTHPDHVIRKQQYDHMEASIIKASQLGAKMVRVTAGQAHPETPRKEGMSWVIESFKRLSQSADRNNIRLVYENHSKPGIWSYPDFSMHAEIFLQICEKISDTQIAILFDTANPLVCGEDPKFVLEQVIDRIVCVHAADTKMIGSLKPVVIGTGVVPFDGLFGRLSHFGYDGVISIEEASNKGESGVAEAVRFVRNTWAKAGGHQLWREYSSCLYERCWGKRFCKRKVDIGKE